MASAAETTKVHFRVLDGWRGIAALLVALFHLNLYSAIYPLDFVRNGYLFVDFFFVLSGFVITYSYGDRLKTAGDLAAFAVRRFGRLWPLHVVVLLAFVAAESAKAVLAARGAAFYLPPFTGANSLDTLPINLVFGQSFGLIGHLTWNPPSWSICAEFWTYLVFAAVLVASSTWLGRFRFATLGVIGMILAISVSMLVLFAPHGMDVSYDFGFVRCLYGFFVGHLTYRLFQVTPRATLDSRFPELAALIGIVWYVSAAGRGAPSFFAPLVFAAAVFVFAFEAGPVSRLMSNRVNDWLGKVSYSIYMWQAFIIFNFVDRPVSIVEKITGRVLTTTEGISSALGGEAGKLIVLGGQVLSILATLLFLAVLVAVASVSYYLIERPGQKLFAHLAQPRWRLSPPAVRTLGVAR
ncbi:MAG TPA: acyltransferase [Bradyrhizobium sp.]|uniref:acyltransferase family protein n=1 Tax=Bradyrhizobium sp. TaxID=376 RepID=UPI002D80463F|nr:acyltransferase [Bradyrhizobium sp.]HET7888059.1 acyltransferase [Bradyrhizobium sp.]